MVRNNGLAVLLENWLTKINHFIDNPGHVAPQPGLRLELQVKEHPSKKIFLSPLIEHSIPLDFLC